MVMNGKRLKMFEKNSGNSLRFKNKRINVNLVTTQGRFRSANTLSDD